MTSKDGQDTNHEAGSLAPDQVTSAPLQRTGLGASDPLVTGLLTGTPEPAKSPENTDAAPETPAPADDQAGEASTTEGSDAPPADDPYQKQLSQQISTMNTKFEQVMGQLAEIKGQTPAASDAPPAEPTADQAQALQEAESDLSAMMDEFSELEKSLDERGEYEGVEPKDLKAIIKGFGKLSKQLDTIKSDMATSQQQAAQAQAQSSVQQFFEQESKEHGIDAEAIWAQASEDAVRYLGSHEPGTQGYDMARQFAQQRYGELRDAAKADKAPDSASADSSSAPTPASPLQRGPGIQPRQDPKGTVTQPAGARPAVPGARKAPQEIINNLIVPD